jgi:hypothetical protein
MVKNSVVCYVIILTPKNSLAFLWTLVIEFERDEYDRKILKYR